MITAALETLYFAKHWSIINQIETVMIAIAKVQSSVAFIDSIYAFPIVELPNIYYVVFFTCDYLVLIANFEQFRW